MLVFRLICMLCVWFFFGRNFEYGKFELIISSVLYLVISL